MHKGAAAILVLIVVGSIAYLIYFHEISERDRPSIIPALNDLSRSLPKNSRFNDIEFLNWIVWHRQYSDLGTVTFSEMYNWAEFVEAVHNFPPNRYYPIGKEGFLMVDKENEVMWYWASFGYVIYYEFGAEYSWPD